MFLKILVILFMPLYIFASAEIYQAKIGFLSKLSANIKYSNSQEAMKIVLGDIAREIDSTFKLTSYNEFEEINKDYFNGEIEMMGIDIKSYLENYKELDFQTQRYLTLTKKEKTDFDKMYLIVNKNLKDKKNLSFSMKNDDFLTQIFLDNSTKKKSLKIKDIKYFDNYNTVILKTLFKELDACIVPSYVYDIVYELNPSVKKNLEIIDISDDIYLTNVVLIKKSFHKKKIEDLERRFDFFSSSAKKQGIFDLIKVKEMIFLEFNDIKKLHKIYEEYKNKSL